MYGMNESEYEPKTLTTFGPSTGLKLLLDVHQEEYCITKMERYGAGFRAFVHDTRSQSTLNLDSTMQLSPGYAYTISLTPTSFDLRNFTEWLGKCTSHVYNFLKPDLPGYNQEACFTACLAETVWRRCKCLPLDETTLTSLKKSASKYLGTPQTSLSYCHLLDDIQRNCLVDQMVNYSSKNADVLCPKCKRSCFETKYDYKITAQKLPVSTLTRSVSVEGFADKRRLEKNYLLVSFVFQDLNMIRIRELQSITPTTLYTNFGGTLGLFLGFSSVVIYEIAHHILVSLMILLTRTFKSKKEIGTNFVVRRKPKPTSLSKLNSMSKKEESFMMSDIVSNAEKKPSSEILL